MTDTCLVDLIDMYDANCFMMLQKLLKAVKRFSRLEKNCVSYLKLIKADKGLDVVSHADVDAEECADDSLVDILKLKFG